MPYVSAAQERFFNSPAGRKKIGGKVVDEWNRASKGMKLPERVSTRKPEKKKRATTRQ